MQFETSGKWPDDVTAIQHIKAAFHIRLAELLKTECSLVTVVSPKYVDVHKVSNCKDFEKGVMFIVSRAWDKKNKIPDRNGTHGLP